MEIKTSKGGTILLVSILLLAISITLNVVQLFNPSFAKKSDKSLVEISPEDWAEEKGMKKADFDSAAVQPEDTIVHQVRNYEASFGFKGLIQLYLDNDAAPHYFRAEDPSSFAAALLLLRDSSRLSYIGGNRQELKISKK